MDVSARESVSRKTRFFHSPGENALTVQLSQGPAEIQRALFLARLEPLLRIKAKENQQAGGGGGKAGCQKSDKVLLPLDTKRELAKAAHVSHDGPPELKDWI